MRKLSLGLLLAFVAVVLPFAASGADIHSPTTGTQITTNFAALPSFAFQDDGTLGNPNVKVWVNTKSGVYHCPGTRWYGNTKQGVYMTQAEAQKKGYRPAYGKVCQ